MKKTEPCVCNLQCVYLGKHSEEAVATMSPRGGATGFLEEFITKVKAPAAPEVYQVDVPSDVVHISTVLQAAHEDQPRSTITCRGEEKH